MICKIDDIVLKASSVTGLDESLDINFAEINRIYNNPYHQDLNGYKEQISIKGELIKNDLWQTETLKEIAKKKRAVRYTTLEESFLVLVVSVKVGKKFFIRGKSLYKSYEIVLKRWYL